jgi:protein-S-isoprenylcysteine O-methyltransferase Ste14
VRISRKRFKPRLLAMYVLAAVLIFGARPTAASLLLGGLVIAAGEGLRLWATGFLHKTESLTVAGPYAYLRHPLYLGTLLIAGGFALAANTAPALWIFAVFMLGYFGYYLPYKNRIEGARLEALFGDEYRRYAVAVPRILPRLHPYVPLGSRGSADWTRVRFADNNELGTTTAVALGFLGVVARWLSI